MVSSFDTVLVVILSYMTFLLIYQYRLTGLSDYLIFSNLFSLTLFHRFLVIILNIDNDSVYTATIPKWEYLLVIQVNFIFSAIGWYSVFIIAGRLNNRKKGPIFYSMTIYFVIIILLSLVMRIQDIPDEYRLGGFVVHSTDFAGTGAAVIYNDVVIFGQGYFYLLAGFRLIGAFSLFFMFLTIKNPLFYPQFKKIQFLWVFSMFWYMMLQVLYLTQTATGMENIDPFLSFARLISTFSLFYVSIAHAEGFLLPNAQIMRVHEILKNNRELLPDRSVAKIFNLNHLVEYITLVENQDIGSNEDKLS